MTARPFVSGFVSLLGRPNAGKSTLLNALSGAKLSIVAPQPQTTRTAVKSVVTLPHAQIVFLDTPGIHESGSLLNRRMMDTVRAALAERDVLLYLADATESPRDEDARAVEMLGHAKTPAFLLLNKVDDLPDKSRLLALIEYYRALRDFVEYIPISARKGTGLDLLRNKIVERLPEGPRYYPANYITDQPDRFLAAELIRERILRETRQEIPHAVAVLVESWEVAGDLTRIHAEIYVERPGQKAIVIGAGGAMLKKIGTSARREMERLFSRKIYLDLRVKVWPHWRDDHSFLASLYWHQA